MGYKSYTLELDGQKNYTVNLKSETAKLQEVVVTGYQKIEKEKLPEQLLNRHGCNSADRGF